jgi:hypothetical protein
MFDSIIHPEHHEVSAAYLGIFEIEALQLPTLMYQTGYLTLTTYHEEADTYQLGYPNHEVKMSLQKYLLGIFTSLDAGSVEQTAFQLKAAFQSCNICNGPNFLDKN